MLKITASLSAEKRLCHLTDRLTSVRGILIVPEQFLFETERSMYRLLGARKIAETEITGFSRLAADVVARYGEPKLYSDDIVKSVTMYKTLNRIKSGFTYFSRKVTFDMTRQMLDIVAEFKSAAVTPALFDAAGNARTGKLADIDRVYSTYSRTLDDEFADRLDDCRIAADLIREHDCFAGRDIFLYEFDRFSGSQLALIKVLAQSADVEIILRTDTRVSERSELRAVNGLIARLGAGFAELEFEELGGEENAPETALLTADNICDECEFVCAEIRRLITQCGYSCNEIAVLLCDSGTTPRLKEAMAEYDISCYTDLPEPILSKPMTRFVISALEATSLNTPELLSYIRSGFVRVPPSLEKYNKRRRFVCVRLEPGKRFDTVRSRATRRLSKRSMDAIERNAFRFALTRREWAKPFPESNRYLNGIEPLRRGVIQPLIDLRNACENSTGDKITEVLCEFLLDTMQLQRTVQGLCTSPELTSDFRQIWDLLIDVFESLHVSLAGEPMTLAAYTELLRGVCADVNIAKPPQVLDAVAIGDLSRSRLAGIRIAFAVGANAGRFPKSTAVTGILSGKELESLKIIDSLADRYNYERLMVNKARTLPSEKLYITAPLTDSAWNELALAPIFAELPHSKTSDLPLSFRVRTDKSARRIFAERDDIRTEIIHSLLPETAEKLFSFENLSPSAIETMMSCRFKYFCRYGLGLDIPALENEEEPAALERGNIIHHCLDSVLRTYKDNLDRLYMLTDADLAGFVEGAIKEYRSAKLPYDYAKSKRQEYILMSFKTGIVRMLKHIRDDFVHGNYTPCEFEKKIDWLCGDVRISGKIDRLDRRDSGSDTYIRVTDYKSGSKEMDFPAVFNGLDMQMLLYLFAACDEGVSPPSRRLPAAALYMPADGARSADILEPGDCAGAERRSWLSAHIAGGIAVCPGDLELAETENRYRAETDSPRKSFFKLTRLTPAACDKLKHYCGRLINVQVRRVKRGEIAAVPVGDSPSKCPACKYCDFSRACGKSRVKLINRNGIGRITDENMD
jgi:ATP-dependent helicase/nuclease subunit B